MDCAQPTVILFSVGDVCVDRTKFHAEKALRMQTVQIRKFSGDKAIVHYTHCPMGMVFAVDVRLLNAVDGEGFLRPSPYFTGLLKRAADEARAEVKRVRV